MMMAWTTALMRRYGGHPSEQGDMLDFRALDPTKTTWSADKIVVSAGFWRVTFDVHQHMLYVQATRAADGAREVVFVVDPVAVEAHEERRAVGADADIAA
jgi:hypothetical protein